MEKKLKAAQQKKRIALDGIKALEFFQAKFTEEEANQIPEVLLDLDRYKEEFYSALVKLEELDDSDEAIEARSDERNDLDARCRRLRTFLKENGAKNITPANPEVSGFANSTFSAFGRPSTSNIRLPKIELPSFDGDVTKWLSFRDRFVAMIDASPELPLIAKLQYLLSALKGDAAVPFEHITLTAENYASTWASLLKRFDNSRLLIREYYRKLHHLPAVRDGNASDLMHLVDEFTRHVNGLVKLKEPIESWDTPLCNLLLLKLDDASILAWEKQSVHCTKDVYPELLSFIEDRIQILKASLRFVEEDSRVQATGKQGTCPMKVAGTQRNPASRRTSANAAMARPLTSSPAQPTSPQPKCALGCSSSHWLRNCPEFNSKDVDQRRELVSAKRLCWNCLSPSHQVRTCSSEYSCRLCHQRHNTLLHTPANPAKVTMAVHSNDMVFLETVLLEIIDDYGNRHEARALLDSGSMPNVMSTAMARQLTTTRRKVDMSVSGVGNSVQVVKGAVTATVRSKVRPYSTQMEFLVLDAPTSSIPTASIDVSAWCMPNVPLADPAFSTPGKIDIVIGGDTYWELHSGQKRSLGKGKPWLVETPFGWVVAGISSIGMPQTSSACLLSTAEASLDSVMERFWQSETVAEDPVLSVEEDHCEQVYKATTTRNAAGRYVVQFPRSSDPSIFLGASKQIADRRLLAMERRLKSNSKMKMAYVEFMRDYERLGHMKKLSEPIDDSVLHYYVPHHAVVKESSTTTKVRVVFDASCKTTSGWSLNDMLLVGPVIQQDLYSIMLRFRSHPIALVADVEKMYRQVLHDASDRNLLRIRYREESSDPISTYELQTVTYGTASAPFLATRTLKQIALDYKDKYPLAANPVLNDFYVDDLLTGTRSVSQAVEMRQQISSMLESAGFILKKWASNIPNVLTGLPQEDLAIQPSHEWSSNQCISTLGLVWEPASDELHFRIEITPAESVVTKRLVLSHIARIFDILGLLGPTIVVAKIFMQKLWSVRPDGKALDWDSALPSHLEHEWKKFHSTLSSLRELKVPRFVAQRNALKSQLHIFADASQEAYGACCYVRTESPSGSSVVLLTAKSKVVSLKNAHSIARLELCAARLATRLVQKVSLSLEVPLTFFYWTDSSTVLHWLKSPPRRWKPFVANRVAQIQRDSEITCWRHIPGVDNPADDISRGLSPDTLLECQRWWHGPHWLSLGAEHWPQGGAESEEEIDLSDERNIPQLVATTVNGSDVSAKLFERFSSYLKLQRATAYWLRYFDCLKNAGTDCGSTRCATTIDPLTKDELQRAELKLCKLSQQISFAEEIQILQAGSDVSRGSRLKWLSPFVDASGVLRVGGRLRNAQLDIATKHPIVLSSKHPLASLLVEAYHTKLLHAGPQLLLATLRNKFWILGGRSLCKTVFHRCVKCFKVKPTLVKQSVADLPTSRVSPSRPFSVCGVDYCGPVMLKSAIRNRSATKAYIAIFVCFATRAVHIELVHDLTTTAFLSALRRFVARRGQIREIHSDNATTFKGAAHDLHRVYQNLKCSQKDRDAVFNWCANNEVQWKFIPPRAPHFGGLWEAAVRSAKQHLIRTLGSTSLTQEAMLTLLAQVEQCLNSRPLIPLSSEPTDTEPLTPGHFLIGSGMFALPQEDLSEVPSNRLREYQLVQKHVQGIWKRWYPEYLQQLQARAKNSSPTPVTLKEGQLVIVKEDNIPPTLWPMGRIVKIHPGKDGVVRVVTLRTAAGKETTRAVARLAILPNQTIT